MNLNSVRCFDTSDRFILLHSEFINLKFMKMNTKILFFGLLFLSLTIISCNSTSTKDGSTTKTEDKTKDDKKEDKKEKDTRFTDENNSFKINFPGEPTLSKEKIEIASIPVQFYNYEYTIGENKIYAVTYADYPVETIDGTKSKETLSSVKANYLKNVGITAADEEKEIKLGDYNGIYFKAKKDGFYTVMQDYLVDNRLYQLGISNGDGYPTAKEIEDFFDSFELIEK